ncbi:anti-sigma factor family protein [Diaphorobacter sp.]|uniref:anti-sigma factor family protein n=1 Tax=Diaphorobacter sp. TaxID=1934310 RepID=UPI003D09F53D
MKPDTIRPADDAPLHALADERLSPADAQALRSRLDLPQQQCVDAWARQRAQLQGLHADWLQQPVPGAMAQAAERLQDARNSQRQWAHWGGIAAGWLIAFGLGWGLHGARGPDSHLATAPAPQLFAQQAAVAHAVFQPEQRHPVEVPATQQDHLVQWLSKRLARPLSVPQLQAQGFELMGGRLLPGASGARAQFMYQNAAGTRITLYLGALDGEGHAAAAQATAFQFHDEGAVSSFYWADQGFGYALSGQLPRPALQALAAAVYWQISAAPPAGANVPARGS